MTWHFVLAIYFLAQIPLGLVIGKAIRWGRQ